MMAVHASTLGANPIGREARAAARGGERLFGALSIETFVNQGPLSLTHDDAEGWLEYLQRWHVPNFHFRDGNVSVWAYEEDFDNWEDTYGLDSVLAVYHSGHGGMDGNGVFFAPLGGVWDNRSDALSSNMRLGNEVVNYVFWSTCFSLRVKDGHDPVRTWHPANLGFRMLFGFETTSVDHSGYGRFFWEEYNRPKSFARAWLDASWRISQSQEPSVVAAGASGEEALARLNNERTLEWGHVSNGWYQWWWYDRARAADHPEGVAARTLQLPKKPLVAELRPPASSLESMNDLTARLGSDLPEPSGPQAGFFITAADGQSLSMGADGAYELRFAQHGGTTHEALDIGEAKRRAEEVVAEHGLDEEVDLDFDLVRHTLSAGGGSEPGAGREDPHVIETTVQFRQRINDLPVVSQSAGDIRITLDNDGRLTSIQNTTRPVERLTEHPKNMTLRPGSGGQEVYEERSGDPEQLLAAAWEGHQARAAREESGVENVTMVPDTTEVGYDVRANEARLVARREVEVDFGGGIRKRYEVIAPIVE